MPISDPTHLVRTYTLPFGVDPRGLLELPDLELVVDPDGLARAVRVDRAVYGEEISVKSTFLPEETELELQVNGLRRHVSLTWLASGVIRTLSISPDPSVERCDDGIQGVQIETNADVGEPQPPEASLIALRQGLSSRELDGLRVDDVSFTWSTRPDVWVVHAYVAIGSCSHEHAMNGVKVENPDPDRAVSLFLRHVRERAKW